MNETQVVAIQNIILWLDMSNYVYVCCVCCFLVESIPDYWVDICQSDCWLQRLLGGQMVELLWASQETAVVNDCSGSPWEISECVCVCVSVRVCVSCDLFSSVQVANLYVLLNVLAIHLFFKPYTKTWQNILEAVILLNYSLLMMIRSTPSFLDTHARYAGIQVG